MCLCLCACACVSVWLCVCVLVKKVGPVCHSVHRPVALELTSRAHRPPRNEGCELKQLGSVSLQFALASIGLHGFSRMCLPPVCLTLAFFGLSVLFPSREALRMRGRPPSAALGDVTLACEQAGQWQAALGLVESASASNGDADAVQVVHMGPTFELSFGRIKGDQQEAHSEGKMQCQSIFSRHDSKAHTAGAVQWWMYEFA